MRRTTEVSNQVSRTLVFCTSYAGTPEAWEDRWRRWTTYLFSSPLVFDQAWIVDDGSPCLPSWPGLAILDAEADPAASSRLSVHRFATRLGQHGETGPFPGWYRSFAYAIRHGIASGFDRIIHIESDAYLISRRAFATFNAPSSGWLSLWCPRHRWPESTLQLLDRSGFALASDFFARPYLEHSSQNVPIEQMMPFTYSDKRLIGDRYGESHDIVPYDIDFVSQVRWGQPDSYYWWMHDRRYSAAHEVWATQEQLCAAYGTQPKASHDGVPYRNFLSFLDGILAPESYLEIGTEHGASFEAFSCKSIGIDPHFRIGHDVIGKKPAALLFQMTSDDFFKAFDPSLLIGKPDIAFLDGLHLYEALLSDLLNFERFAHQDSVAILHDCLPLNARMTSREHVPGPPEEDEETRHFWTGDVWKVLPMLKELRPALDLLFVDCPPTGLVLCRGFGRSPATTADQIQAMIAKYRPLTLDDFGIARLRSLVPTLSSHEIMRAPALFRSHFRLRRGRVEAPLQPEM